MACIDDSGTYLFTVFACFNFIPYFLVGLNPLNPLLSLFICFNLGIIGVGFLAANFPSLVSLADVASAMPILFIVTVAIWCAAKFFAVIALLFVVLGLFGGASVINREHVQAGFEHAIGIGLNTPGYYALVVVVIVFAIALYYAAMTSKWMAFMVQTFLFSIMSSVSIRWLAVAGIQNFVVCCDADNLNTCPISLEWWVLALVVEEIAKRIALKFFWYEFKAKQRFMRDFKKFNKPEMRYPGKDFNTPLIIYRDKEDETYAA